jgi:hypothetical protein
MDPRPLWYSWGKAKLIFFPKTEAINTSRNPALQRSNDVLEAGPSRRLATVQRRGNYRYPPPDRTL